jgi:hypothetical protein
MTFPDLPFIPDLPGHRVENMTVRQVLNQASAALHAAAGALHELEHDAPTIRQFPNIRQIVIECRRSTFVLQKLSSRVVGWDEWWAPRQAELRADPLMRYFHNLRTEIEKQGLPAAMAVMYDLQTGATIADVACGEDQFGVWIGGAVRRSGSSPVLPLDEYPDFNTFGLRDFRLADPPLEHDGQPLVDFRFSTLADLAIAYLSNRIIQPATVAFGDSAS